MTALLQLRDAIAFGLKNDARLVALKAQVVVHGGDFKLEDLKRYGANAPAVVLSLLHVKADQEGPSLFAMCTFGVVCLARALPTVNPPRDQHAAGVELLDATMRALRGEFWGDATLQLSAPDSIDARNMFGSALDQVGGVSMWALGFKQKVELFDADTSVDFQRWDAVWDPQPTDVHRPHVEQQGTLT